MRQRAVCFLHLLVVLWSFGVGGEGWRPDADSRSRKRRRRRRRLQPCQFVPSWTVCETSSHGHVAERWRWGLRLRLGAGTGALQAAEEWPPPAQRQRTAGKRSHLERNALIASVACLWIELWRESAAGLVHACLHGCVRCAALVRLCQVKSAGGEGRVYVAQLRRAAAARRGWRAEKGNFTFDGKRSGRVCNDGHEPGSNPRCVSGSFAW